jgi:hypothetical protein
MNYVEKYNVTELFGLSEEDFNAEVEHAISIACDLVPYDSPNYDDEVVRLAIAYVQCLYDPDFISMAKAHEMAFDALCKEHDEMLGRGELDNIKGPYLPDDLPF